MILIYITYPDIKTAKKIAKVLLGKRLIACATFSPIESMYWWKGKIENTKEIVSIVKTKNSNWKKIKSEVTKLHPYETPCIIKIDAEANKDYSEWIDLEVK